MPLQVDVKQAAVIDELAGDRSDDRDEDDSDLLRADRPVPDKGRNKQQVLFQCVSELGRRVG